MSGNSSSSGGSCNASPNGRKAELNYSANFFGNSRYAATGLYYDISGQRRPLPSLEVEADADWRVKGAFCDVVYLSGINRSSRVAKDVMTYKGCWSPNTV